MHTDAGTDCRIVYQGGQGALSLCGFVCVISGDTLTLLATVSGGSVPGFQSITRTLEGVGDWLFSITSPTTHFVWLLGLRRDPRGGLRQGAMSRLIHDRTVLEEAATGLLDGAGLSSNCIGLGYQP